MRERGRGALAFLAIVGGVPALGGARGHALEIARVSIERVGARERSLRFRRQIARVRGAEPDHGEAAAHGRCSHPGTSTIAK
jgi:hypothetical protein